MIPASRNGAARVAIAVFSILLQISACRAPPGGSATDASGVDDGSTADTSAVGGLPSCVSESLDGWCDAVGQPFGRSADGTCPSVTLDGVLGADSYASSRLRGRCLSSSSPDPLDAVLLGSTRGSSEWLFQGDELVGICASTDVTQCHDSDDDPHLGLRRCFGVGACDELCALWSDHQKAYGSDPWDEYPDCEDSEI